MGTEEQNEQNEQNEQKRPSYRDSKGKMISLEEAKRLRLARVKDGMPTKIWELQEAKRLARKNGEPEPVRQWTNTKADQEYNGITSPYDLTRRSGQRIIWQALAATPNEPISIADLESKVLTAYKDEFPEYYNDHYTDSNPFGVVSTAQIMSRDAKLDAVNQRVDVDIEAGTAVLMTGVTEPRQPKKRGPKPKVTVEPDTDADAEIGVETEAEVATA